MAPELEKLGAQVLGVSCDSRITLAAWKQAMGYPVRLISDFWPHGEIGKRFDVFDPVLGMNSRTTFIVDRDGIVRAIIATEMSRSRDIESFPDAVRKLG